MRQNPFKQLELKKDQRLPENFKQEVMESIETAKIVLGIADLFTFKMGETFTGIFRTQNFEGKGKKK
jgi:hypothetical protein